MLSPQRPSLARAVVNVGVGLALVIACSLIVQRLTGGRPFSPGTYAVLGAILITTQAVLWYKKSKGS